MMTLISREFDTDAAATGPAGPRLDRRGGLKNCALPAGTFTGYLHFGARFDLGILNLI